MTPSESGADLAKRLRLIIWDYERKDSTVGEETFCENMRAFADDLEAFSPTIDRVGLVKAVEARIKKLSFDTDRFARKGALRDADMNQEHIKGMQEVLALLNAPSSQKETRTA